MIELAYQQFGFKVDDDRVDFFARYGTYEPHRTIFRAILATHGFFRDDKGDFYTYSEDSTQKKSDFCEIETKLTNAIKEAFEVLDHLKCVRECNC